MSSSVQRGGTGLIALSATVGLAFALYNYYARSSGIDGTPGALLVIVSSAVIAVVAAALSARSGRRGWFGTLLFVLILVGILGTALAAYFLESQWLLLAMGIAMLGWLAATRRPSKS